MNQIMIHKNKVVHKNEVTEKTTRKLSRKISKLKKVNDYNEICANKFLKK